MLCSILYLSFLISKTVWILIFLSCTFSSWKRNRCFLASHLCIFWCPTAVCFKVWGSFVNMDAQIQPKEFMLTQGTRLLPDSHSALSSFFSDCLKHLSVSVGWTSGKALHCRCQSRHQMKLKNSDYTNVFTKFRFQANQYVYFQKHTFLHLRCEMHLNKGFFFTLEPATLPQYFQPLWFAFP